MSGETARLLDMTDRNIQTMVERIESVDEPRVEEQTYRAALEDHSPFGTVEDQAALLERIHGIPAHAERQVERDVMSRQTIIRWRWWTVEVRVRRPNPRSGL